MAHGEINHRRPTISFENIAIFKTDEDAFSHLSNSGSGIDLVENVQSANFAFSIDNKREGELGDKEYIDSNYVRAPEVALTISKYENMDGLFTDFFSGGKMSDTNKDRNFYMFFSDQKNQDVFPGAAESRGHSQLINNMTDISGKDILAFGNAFLSNVSINQSVGGLLESEYQYTCSNILAEKVRIENVDPDQNIAYANLFDNMDTDKNMGSNNRFKEALKAPKDSGSHKATGFLGFISKFGGQLPLHGDRDRAEPPFTNIDAGFTPSGKSLVVADVGNAFALSPTGFRDLAVYVISGTYRTTGVRELMVPSGFCFNLVHETDETQSIRATGFSITGGGGAHSVAALNTSQLNSYTGHWVTTAITGGNNVRISFVKTGSANPTGGPPCYIVSGFNLTHETSQIFGTGLEPNFFPHQTNYNFATPYKPGTGVLTKNPFGPTGGISFALRAFHESPAPNGGLTQIVDGNHIMPFTGISGYGFNLGGTGTHALPLPMQGVTNVGPQPLTQVSGDTLINHSGNLILVDSIPNVMFYIGRSIYGGGTEPSSAFLGTQPIFSGSSTGARDFFYTGIYSATDLPLLFRGTDKRFEIPHNSQITTGSVILKDLFIKKTGEYVVSNPAIQLTGSQQQQTISAKLGNMPTGKGTRFSHVDSTGKGAAYNTLQPYLKSNKTTASGGFYPYYKTHINITTADPDVREFLINSQNIQNFSIDIPIQRRNVYSLGKQYPVYKKEVFPSDCSFSFSNLVSTFVTGEVGSDKVNLKSFLNENESYIINFSGENYYDDRNFRRTQDLPPNTVDEEPADMDIAGTGLVYNSFNYVITGAKLSSLNFNNGGVDGGATSSNLEFKFDKENFLETFSIPISGRISGATDDIANVYRMTNIETGAGFKSNLDVMFVTFSVFATISGERSSASPTIVNTDFGTIRAFNGKQTITVVMAANGSSVSPLENRVIDWPNCIVSGCRIKSFNSTPSVEEVRAVPDNNIAANPGFIGSDQQSLQSLLDSDRVSIAEIEVNTNTFNPDDVIFFQIATKSAGG